MPNLITRRRVLSAPRQAAVVAVSPDDPTWATVTGVTGSPANGATWLLPQTGLCYDNVLHTICGYNQYNGVMKFDLDTLTWSTGAAPGVNMHEVSAAKITVSSVVRFYRFGGNDVTTTTDDYANGTSAYYTPSANTWTSRAALNFEVRSPAVAVDETNQYIYVIGGTYHIGANAESRAVLQRVNIAANTVTTLTSMPDHRGLAAAGLYNGSIYVIGGLKQTGGVTTSPTTVYKYNIAGNSWSTLAEACPKKMSYINYVQDGKWLYLFGFFDFDLATQSAECYAFNMETETWHNLTNDLNQARYSGGCAKADDGNFYVIMGYAGSAQSTILRGTV